MGSYGVVYRGEDRRLGSAHPQVAIKVFRPDFESASRQEIALLFRMQHEHLIRPLAWCEKRAEGHTTLWLVMELAVCSLDAYLAKPAFTDAGLEMQASLLRWWLFQVSMGLAFLHMNPVPVAHRDIKPNNMLLVPGHANAELICKLCDLGVSRVMGTTDPTTMVGAEGFMAPEIIAHRPYKVSADIYSLGLCVFALYGGRRLQLPQLAVDSGRRFPTMPPWARLLILSCTRENPDERPSIMHIVNSLLPDQEPPVAPSAAGEHAPHPPAERECIICLTRPRSVRFLPCRHRVACAECARRCQGVCPIDRQAGCTFVVDNVLNSPTFEPPPARAEPAPLPRPAPPPPRPASPPRTIARPQPVAAPEPQPRRQPHEWFHSRCELPFCRAEGLCCHCADKRPIAAGGGYAGYVDAGGMQNHLSRSALYCPSCRQVPITQVPQPADGAQCSVC